MKKAVSRIAFFSVCAVVLPSGAVEIQPPTDGGNTRFFEAFMPAKDGVRLYTLGTAPADREKCPTIIVRMPYVRSARADKAKWIAENRKYTRRGYSRIYQHCRGCGMSEGDWIPYENEREDGLALLEFVRKLPWYNGEIFLTGSSYCASAHFSCLDTDPPDVKGAALLVQDANRYNVCYRNGFFKIGLHGSWFIKGYKKKDAALQRDKSVTFAQFPLAAFSSRYWGEEVPAFDNVLRHPRATDPFWASGEPGSGMEFRRALLDSSMPVLLKTAFYDIYTDGVCAMWRELPESRKANCSLVIDACNHSGRAAKGLEGTLAKFPGGTRADGGVEDMDWFDAIRNRKECENAPYGKTRYYALWENKWLVTRDLEDGEREISVTLGEGERSFKYDPRRDLPVFPGSGGMCFGGMAVQPPPGFRDDVLSFLLPPVKEELDVRGRMEAVLTVASDREDTCFYIRVSVDKGDGKWLLLRDDITSLAREAVYIPGSRRQLRFRFADHAFRLSEGDGLRVDVAGACAHFAPHPNRAGDAFAVDEPLVATNTVIAAESKIVFHAIDRRLTR